MIPSRGIAAEDFFDADSVDDGVDVALLEVFQVQLPVGVDDDGVPVQPVRVRSAGRSGRRFPPGGSARHPQGDGRKRLLEKTASLHGTYLPRINFGPESLRSSLQATHPPPSELHRIMNTELRGARQGPNSQYHLAWPVREPIHHRGGRAGVPLRDRARSRISLNRLRPIAPSFPSIPDRSGGRVSHSSAPARSDLPDRTRLPRPADESGPLGVGTPSQPPSTTRL